jgi:hypothetical protein
MRMGRSQALTKTNTSQTLSPPRVGAQQHKIVSLFAEAIFLVI